MNCLLLLILLFCCNGNNNYNVGSCNMKRGRAEECKKEKCCDGVSYPHTPPPMPRTQFPYLDVEPRTCGCEEKSGS